MNIKISLGLLLPLLISVTTWGQSIIPLPNEATAEEGYYRLHSPVTWKSNINPSSDDHQKLADAIAIYLPDACETDNAADINLYLSNKEEGITSPEGYTLDITPDNGILIKAIDRSGLFYGLQSVLQMIQPRSIGYQIPCYSITDNPELPYRGLMLDVSRHFFDKSFIKKQMKAMAAYKLNHLHLHLTDATGWRLQIDQYPLLTEVAAWRPMKDWKQWWYGKREYAPSNITNRYGGHYTKADIKDLLKLAELLNITIIPEIEMPGHSEEVLAVYPELSCTGKPYTSSDFCIGNEETFTFLQNILDEVMDLFPSKYIHIGGDEASKQQWKTCPKCQELMKRQGMKHVDELQSYMIHRIEKYLNDHGRTLIGWDEILQGGLAPNATVMSWRGTDGGIEAIKSGHQAIMTPDKYCYINFYQDAPLTQEEAIGGYLPLEKVYRYNPRPDTLSRDEKQLIYGLQANLWTEYIPEDSLAERMIYPRILAIAENGWSRQERKNWDSFRYRVMRQTIKLQKAGYHPFDIRQEVGARSESIRPIRHLAEGMIVTYNHPYHPAYKANGSYTLTDGICGNWEFNDGRWQGFLAPRPLDVTIDLQKETEISTISATFLQSLGVEIYLPSEVIISISNDGKEFKKIHHITHAFDNKAPLAYQKFGWQGQETARYIRYIAKEDPKHLGWVFSDEIIIK